MGEVKFLTVWVLSVLWLSHGLAQDSDCTPVDFLNQDEIKSVCLHWESMAPAIITYRGETCSFMRVEGLYVYGQGKKFGQNFYFAAWDKPTLDAVCEALGFYPTVGETQNSAEPWVGEPEEILVWREDEAYFHTSEHVARHSYSFAQNLWCPTEAISKTED